MINRFALAATAAVLSLTGCATTTASKSPSDFSTGATQVTVTDIPIPAADGSTLYVTVDGNDAAALIAGESVTLHVPAGKHQVGAMPGRWWDMSPFRRFRSQPIPITRST
ncbi:hypothetical protein ABK905_14065 [Acerihabitans sp. KWT182]|uniref:Bacterial Ig domain-containing protein n=1 Tax=Acerihabitans sp. KWT182 TaxID=3157919 RepID=A0AAU7Q6H9_9GAMM